MSGKTIRLDSEVLNELQKRSEGKTKTPNQILRGVLGLPENKERKSRVLSKDHLSKAERYLLKALDELRQVRKEEK